MALDLSTLKLLRGAHYLGDGKACLLEAVAMFAGELKTDAPRCVSVVLRKFGIEINDAMPNDQRQRLIPFIPRMVGTADDGKDAARTFIAAIRDLVQDVERAAYGRKEFYLAGFLRELLTDIDEMELKEPA